MDIHSRHFKETLSHLKLKDHATWRNCCHFSCFTLEVQSCLTRNCLEPSWLGVGSLQLQFQMSAHCAASKACCFEITWEQCLATDCSDSELHILAAVFVLEDHFVEILLAIRSWDPTWWILGISCTRSLETKMLQGCCPSPMRTEDGARKRNSYGEVVFGTEHQSNVCKHHHRHAMRQTGLFRAESCFACDPLSILALSKFRIN